MFVKSKYQNGNALCRKTCGQMKASTHKTILIIGIVLLTFLIVAVLLESQTRLFHRWYDDVILDNKNHYIPCEALPTESVVKETLDSHQEVIRKIEQVNPGNVGVFIDTFTCPGRADLVIWYASHKDRQAIEQILQDETFFGVPYRLRNQ
ncbi:MAG: hypothetical protein DDG60_10040 [Anaerolineae bacterium]|nr:MAG: hypothetical protein DDG60_10040 [Anaerolineae bacterium]